MSKIGDLFVRLGLKKAEFDQGMDQAAAKTRTFGETARMIGTKVTAIWAAIGVAAVAMADKFAHTSQRFGDQWDQAMSRMKAAWKTFTDSLNTWDWENFGKRIKGAMDAAAASTAAHDAEFEVLNSIAIQRGQMQDELAQLEIMSRDTRRSYAERAAAADEYLRKVRPLYEQEIALREEIRNADVGQYLRSAGVAETEENRKLLEQFLTRDVTDSSRLNSLVDFANRNPGSSALAEIAKYYQDKSNDKDAKKVVDAITGLYGAQAAFNEETRRLQQVKNNAAARTDNGAAAEAQAALEAQRKQAERIAQQAAEYQLSERTQLKKHYEEEKALLEAFGIDTTMLTLKYLDMDQNLTREALEEDRKLLEDQLQEFAESLNVEVIPFEMDPNVQGFLDELARLQEEAEDRAERFKEAITEGFSAGIQELTDQLMGVSQINAGAIFKALLSPLADMAQQEGELLILQGIGIEAIKSALASLNGIAAVAAGTALVAAAAAVKSGLSRIAQGGSAAGVATTGASDVGTGLVGTVQDLELTVKIEGQLRGSDIVLAAERTQANWSR